MPLSLKARFNGNKEEVIEYTRLWGRGKAMDKYGVKDYLAFSKFVEGETSNTNFGVSHTLGGAGNNTWAEDLLDAFVNKVSKMEARKQQLESELHQTQLELEYYKGQQALRIEPKISQVMERCRA